MISALKTSIACRAGVLLAALAVAATPASAQSQDVFNLSLEELMNIEVTSVSRKLQPLAQAPAAVFVISQEDIRRSGSSSLPELLRLVPGVQVTRYSNSKWAISARGMNGYYGSKLLVLVDGRSVYTPNFSGIYWDLQAIPLDTIERVEVIRGPGGTMWGANAVNGVINVITKSAADTQGGLVTTGTGSEDRGLLSLRYGGKVGGRSTYRAYAEKSDRAMDSSTGVEDSSQMLRGGFRLDRKTDRDGVTLQGDLYSGEAYSPIAVPQLTTPFARIFSDEIRTNGGNLLGRWTRTLSPTSNVAIKVYFDHNVRDEYIHRATLDAADVDIQHAMRLGARHDLMWGAEYRNSVANITPGTLITYNPSRSQRQLVSGFAQDEIKLRSNLAFTVGSKVEHHEEIGIAVEPNIRAMWRPAPQHHVWASVSRSVRTPSLADQIATFIFDVLPPSAATRGLPVEVHVIGDPNQQHLESVLAYEVGYRARPISTFAFDIAAFRNDYSHLTSYARRPTTLSLAGGVPHLVLESVHQNRTAGETYGLEVAATVTPTARWSISGTSTFLHPHMYMEDPALDPGRSLLVLQLNPDVQFTLSSLVQLTHRMDVGATFYNVGPWKMGDVEGYTRTDLRAGWKLTKTTTLDAGVQNLFDERHNETALYFYQTPTEIPRSGYARVSWRF